MKILFVCQSYYPEQFKITDIAETLVEEGHEVTVLTGLPNYPQGKIYPGYTNRQNRNQIINGVHIKRAFLIARGSSKIQLFFNYISFAIAASIKALLDRKSYDIVLCYQLSPISMALPAIIIKYRRKIPFILYCLDLWPESLMAGGIRKNSIIYNFFKKISIDIYNSADKILITSPKFKEYFNDTLNINKNIDCLYNFAEDFFVPEKPKLNNKNINLLFAGNIGSVQSVETVIRAAEKLQTYSIVFHIVGDGSEKESLEMYCKEKRLENVIFYGHKPLQDMPRYYKLADACLITLSDNEFISYTIPNKLQSYMAMGKPILGSINGSVKQIIAEADCGYCVKAEDSEGLAESIIKFSKLNENERGRFAMNSLHYYKNNFTKDKFIKNIQKYMSEVVNKNVSR